METTGKITNISISFPSRRAVISFEVAASPEDCEKYQDVEKLDVIFKKHREKRSLSANAYFHVLCDKIRQQLGISMARAKNDLITTYGQVFYLDNGQAWIYKTNAPLDLVIELEEHHLKYIKQDPDDPNIYWYRVYRGSHTYDSKEMWQLIQGTILEAKELGIETDTPDELERLRVLWNGQSGKREGSQRGADARGVSEQPRAEYA